MIAISSDLPPRFVRVLRRAAEPAPRERPSGPQLGNFVSRADGLSAARRAPRLDGRRSGLRTHRLYPRAGRGVLGELAAGPRVGPGRRAGCPERRARRGHDGPARIGRAGWADAATIVPWAVYESYGDADVLRRQFASMRRWVDSLVARQGADGLLEPPGSSATGSIRTRHRTDRGRPRPTRSSSPTPSSPTARTSWPSRRRPRGARGELRWPRARRNRSPRPRGTRGPTKRRGPRPAARSLSASASCPSREQPAVVDALASLVNEPTDGWRRASSAPRSSCPPSPTQATSTEAYRMLLRTGPPSWLYQVEHGATTVWERWDAIRPDGSIHPGTLTRCRARPREPPTATCSRSITTRTGPSSTGCTATWRGSHPTAGSPAIASRGSLLRPSTGSTWARARVASAYGDVAIEWDIDDAGLFRARVGLPSGTSGEFLPPATAASVVTLDGAPVAGHGLMPIGAGEHWITVSSPGVLQDPWRS